MESLTKHSLYRSMDSESILSAIFTIYLRKFLIMFIYTFVAIFIFQLILYYLGFMDLYNVSDPDELYKNLPEIFKKMGIVSVASVIIYGFLNSFLVNYLIKSDINPDALVGDIFAESVKKFSVHMIFFLILSVVILFAGIFVGFIALIIGSLVATLYLGTVMMSGGAILVAEEKNAIETIGRAFTLTHKDFWTSLGAVVLLVLIMILVSLIIAALIAIPFIIAFYGNVKETGNFMDAFDLNLYDIGIWSVVLNSVVSALTYPLYAVLSVVLYFNLKYKEDHAVTGN